MENTTKRYTFRQQRIRTAYDATVRYVALLNDMLALARAAGDIGQPEVERLVELIAEYEDDGEDLINQAAEAGLEPEDLN